MTFNWLSLSSLVVALLFALPLLVITAHLFSAPADVWQHLFNTLLPEYVSSSLLLMLGVGSGVLLLGVTTAWLTSIYTFPGQRILSWALLLPLAFPGYIIAYTYTGLLDPSGAVQSALRSMTGLQYGEYWFFSIRSLGGAIVMLSLVLYPYVYLLARAAFLQQSATIIDASRTLGYNRYQSWLKVGIPMARPAIIAGLTLALMETLADFGTVQYFGVSTFTTGIYRAFYGFGEAAAAAQLSAVLLGFVITLIVLERYSRRQVRYHDQQSRLTPSIRLTGGRAWSVSLLCTLPVLLGFLIPAGVLLNWSLTEATIDKGFAELAWNSFYLAFLAALIAVGLALILAYAKRLNRGFLVNNAVGLTGMGYAMPGTIIAIGVLIPLVWMDQHLISWFETVFDWNPGLILSGTLVTLLFAYSVRFLAVSLGAVESGLQKIKPNIDHAARLSGHKPLALLRLIHLPLLRGSLLTALLIVFVDVLKELPATLILRPFNFNTLAVRAYELASDERLVDAAPASLLIIAVGLIPVIMLSRSIAATNTRRQRSSQSPIFSRLHKALR